MKKHVLSITIVVAVLVLLTYTALFGLSIGSFEIPRVADGIVLGLDLVGGSEITYEAVIPEGTSADDITSGMNSAQAMLRQRLSSLGYTEASVYLSGDTRVVVEIPNVSDPEEAVQQLGTTALVEFADADGTVWLDGTHIQSAVAQYSAIDDSGLSRWHVVLTFTDEGRELFKEATMAVANRSGDDNYVAIMMDGAEISTPYVDKTQYASSGIDSESAIITMGNSDGDSVKYLANIISAGRLPFSLQNIKLQAVGATLGEQSLETSLFAGLIGIILVALFMIIVYRLLGLVSVIALVLYGAIYAVVLGWTGVNLSLPGIAGIILTIGMAVDANVIIYERIKEELRTGKTLRASIDAGFNRAFTSILDSNITTAIAAVVLWWQGTGTIVGFAKTLLIGVIVSMFVMLIVTRFLLRALAAKKVNNLKLYGVGDETEGRISSMRFKFSFISKRKLFYIIALVFVAVGLVGLVALPFGVNLFNFDIDFLGGVTMQYDLHTEITNEVSENINEIVKEVTGADASSVTKAGANGTEVVIKTLEIDTELRDEIFQRCKEEYNLTDADLVSTNFVSSAVGTDLRNAAIMSAVIALALMLLYIAFRFELFSAFAAIVALMHDVLCILSAYIIFQIPFNMNFIAVALTIVGYSINATIVAFDRVRENNRLSPGGDFNKIVDNSIWQTMTRSINTSLTTLFPVVMIAILGVTSIQNFAVPLIVGIICGCYSSVCIAGPTWALLKSKFGKKKA